MTDILKLALDRRDGLHDEIARLDRFIRTANRLTQGAAPRTRTASDAQRPAEAHAMDLPDVDDRDEPGAQPPWSMAPGDGPAGGEPSGAGRRNLLRR